MTGLGLFALFALPSSAMAPVTTLELAAKTELRRREPGDRKPDGSLGARAYDFQIGGMGRLSLNFHRGKISLSYLPQFAYVNFAETQRVTDFSNGIDLASEWHWRRTRLTLDDQLAFGRRDSSSVSLSLVPDPITGATVVQPLPANTAFNYVSTGATAGLGHTLSRRSELVFSAGYGISGGADDASRRVLPLATSQRVVGQWQYRAARPDTLVTEATGDNVHTNTSTRGFVTRSSLAGATERWRHEWTPNTHTELAVGARLAAESRPETTWYGYPAASVTVAHRRFIGPEHAALRLEASAGFDVAIDRLTGLPDRRGQGTALAEWSLRRTTLHLSGGHAQSLANDNPNSLTITYGEAGVAYRLLDTLQLLGGVRAVDQRYRAPNVPAAQLVVNGLQWTTFVGLVFESPPMPL